MALEDNSVRELSKTARIAYQKLGEEYDVFTYKTAYTKPIYFSRAMSYTDLVGIYCPFTLATTSWLYSYHSVKRDKYSYTLSEFV